VTGGYVYRGGAIPDLTGAYLFADFCEGDVKALMPGDPEPAPTDLGIHADNLASFGRDTLGELYVLSLSGPVSRIDPVIP
jgi:hypothetical protein